MHHDLDAVTWVSYLTSCSVNVSTVWMCLFMDVLRRGDTTGTGKEELRGHSMCR